MQQEQIKALLVNIFTGAVILGVIVAGYLVFVKKDTTIINSVTSVAKIAEQTTSIGMEIDATVRDLKDLSDAVAKSKVIFDLPAFQNLENFSVTIPKETVGRINPFVPTAWKLKMKAQEEEANERSSSAQSNAQSASASDPLSQDQTYQSEANDFFNDFYSDN